MSKQLVYLPIDQLHPHPQNPRKELGDLTELADSIKASGVFQNLTVIPGHWMSREEWEEVSRKYNENPTEEARLLLNNRWLDTGYTVIIGHRRRAASKLAGLKELPCAIVEMTRQEQVQTMLLENMQRSDLTVYEQAQGFQLMIEMGDTPASISEKTGFSKKTVNRRLEMARLDQRLLKEVSVRQISLSDFDRLAQIDDVEERNKPLSDIGTGNFNQAFERKLMKQQVGKRLPEVRDLLKERKALKIKYSDTWNGKYKQIGKEHRLHLGDEIEIPTPEKGRLYYCLEEDYGRLRFYEAAQKVVTKRPQAEIDKEKAMEDANYRLDELSAETQKLRRQFADGLRLTARNKEEIFLGALDACFVSTVLYGYGTSELYKAFGIENRYSNDSKLEMYRALKDRPHELIPKLVYGAFCDEGREKYHTDYKRQWPRHKECPRLDILYAWLCSLGYQMSDDERRLQDGSHPLLHLGEEAAGGITHGAQC